MRNIARNKSISNLENSDTRQILRRDSVLSQTNKETKSELAYSNFNNANLVNTNDKTLRKIINFGLNYDPKDDNAPNGHPNQYASMFAAQEEI